MRTKEPINPLDYADDPAGLEVARECERLGIENEPAPTNCKCGAELKEGGGMVGETVLYCPKGCGIAWEDREGAIARVL